jgi:hypothetical protein
MTSIQHNCNDVITIPQTKGTCWFNAILMTILYSQYSRNLLLTNNTLDKKKDKISKILNQLLKKNYIKHEIYEDYFKYMRPEIILKYLDFFPTKKEYKNIIESGYFSNLIINKFIKKLNKTSINLDLYEGELYGHFNLIIENLNFPYEYISLYDIFNIFNKSKNLLLNTKITKEDFTTNPDYIILNPINSDNNLYKSSNNTTFDFLFYLYNNYFPISYVLFYLLNVVFNTSYLLEKFKLKTYDIKTKGITTLENVIIYNGDKYILDSCILANFNKNIIKEGHAIAGITCNNNRFVYNGWLRKFYDIKTQVHIKKLPCELMKFDWDINKPSSFCLNTRQCKLDPADLNEKDNFCFSFDRGERNLIYVKVKNLDQTIYMYQNFSSSNVLTLPSTSNLSNIDEINQKRKIKEILIKKLEAKKKEKEVKKRETEEKEAKKLKEEKKKQKEQEKKLKEEKKKLKEEKKKQKEQEKKLKEEKKKQKEQEKKLKEEKKKQKEEEKKLKEEKKREKEAKKKQKEEKEVKKKEEKKKQKYN